MPGSWLPLRTGAINDIYYLGGWLSTVTTKHPFNPTFIPHFSALDIVNGASKFCFTLSTENNPTFYYHDQFPTDLTSKIIEFLNVFNLNQIPAAQYYNFTDKTSKCIADNLEVYGNLAINQNLLSGYSLNPVGTPPQSNSDYTVITNSCNNTIIDVFSGGSVTIGDNGLQTTGTLRISNGSTLRLRSGSLLQIADNSELIIEPGANLIWENGAQIVLEGYNAIVDIQNESINLTLNNGDNFHIERGSASIGGGVIFQGGTITMNSGSIIHAEGYLVAGKNNIFNYNVGSTIFCEFDQSFVQFEGALHIGADAEFTFSGTGHFKFGLPTPSDWTNIHTGDNATILFEGSGPTDDIVFVFKDTWISNPPAPFTIRNGRVSLGNNSYISIGGDVELNNINVKILFDPINPWHTHNGIYIHGQAISLIERLDISGGKQGLTCRNFFGPSGVTIKESRFHTNGIGVHVFDKKVNFINCDFSNNGIGWSAANMSWNSSALNCLITDNDTGSFFRTAGSAQLILDKCSYLDNYFYGANFAGQNSFIIKCGTYTNWLFGLTSFNNSDLILSPLLAKGAGKVDVSSNEVSNILLGFNNGFTTPIPLSTSAKSLHLEKGFNKLAPDLDCNCGLPAYQLWGRVRDCLNFVIV